jgi:diguanylate cyclase (GGDEF)-like protein
VAFTHLIAVGLEPAALSVFTRQAARAAEGLPVAGVPSVDQLGELMLSDPGCLLVLPFGSDQGGQQALRRLRGRGVLAPALLLTRAADMRQGIDVKGLGAVDFLPIEGYTAFDLKRALLTLDRAHGVAVQLAELEARARELEESHATLLRRMDELLQRVEGLSTTDELTGLENERAMLGRVEEAVRMARRFDTPIACVLVGIDDLAAVAARHGAETADAVLATTARRVQGVVREVDIVARYGDGFLILCPFTPSTGAVTFGRRLREAVELQPVERRGTSVRPRVSVGIAIVRAEVGSPKELIQIAAEALQQARERGGERVVAL